MKSYRVSKRGLSDRFETEKQLRAEIELLKSQIAKIKETIILPEEKKEGIPIIIFSNDERSSIYTCQ